MWSYNHNDELIHYGVPGMKWGVRRAMKKEVKGEYKKAKDKAFSDYEKNIAKIESKYKRGQNLSAQDQKREQDANIKYQNAVKKAKISRDTKLAEISGKPYTSKGKLVATGAIAGALAGLTMMAVTRYKARGIFINALLNK